MQAIQPVLWHIHAVFQKQLVFCLRWNSFVWKDKIITKGNGMLKARFTKKPQKTKLFWKEVTISYFFCKLKAYKQKRLRMWRTPWFLFDWTLSQVYKTDIHKEKWNAKEVKKWTKLKLTSTAISRFLTSLFFLTSDPKQKSHTSCGKANGTGFLSPGLSWGLMAPGWDFFQVSALGSQVSCCHPEAILPVSAFLRHFFALWSYMCSLIFMEYLVFIPSQIY